MDLIASTISAGAGDSGATVLSNHETNFTRAITNLAAAADPAATNEGLEWIRTDEDKKYCIVNGSKTQVLHLHTLTTNLDFNANEARTVHLEEKTTGNLTAAGAAQESRIAYDSTVKQAVLWTAAGRFYLAGFDLTAIDYVAIPCALNVANVGQAATADTTTRWGGWLLDATADELNWVALAPIPAGWTAANDLLLEVVFSLSAAETASDDVDLDCNYHALTAGSGVGTDTTLVAAATVNYDIGAAASQYDIHKLRVTLDWDSPTPDMAAGDWVAGYIIRNTVGGAGKVANIVVHAITLLVPSKRVAWN